MVELFNKGLDVLIAIFMYTSFASAFILFGFSIYRIILDKKKNETKRKPYIVAACCIIYVLLIILIGFERFGTIFSIGFLIFILIATQREKYKDRVKGHRWWTR